MDEDIKAAIETLRKGGVIVYPTDTVWGLGCDATNSEAVRRIFAIKGRADGKALITLTDSADNLYRLVDEVPEVALELIDVAVRPLTIVYDGARTPPLAPELVAPDGSIGIRVTSEEFSRRLCRAFRKPLVSTSANISGQPTPTCFAEISGKILSAADYVATSRRNEAPGAQPSSVIKLGNNGLVKIIRK